MINFSRDFCCFTGSEAAFPFWKGRVALYAFLRAIGVGEGDEVIVPGYTCVMDVNPIIYSGATPRFVDIDPDTFNVDADAMVAKVSERTKVIIAQHTYGIPAPMDTVMEVAQEKGIWVVEDCCLSLGSTYNGRRVGTLGDAAYWSFQWNKPMTTGLGGMLTTNNKEVAEAVERILEQEAVTPGLYEAWMLSAQRLAHKCTIWPRTAAAARHVFRQLSQRGLIVGSSDVQEYESAMPDSFLKRMSPGQQRSGVKKLRSVEENISHRKKIAQFYRIEMREKGWPVPERIPGCEPVYVAFPVRVQDKDAVLERAPGKMLEIGSWFESPLHPKETPLEEYGYHLGGCPVSEKACEEVITLPTHQRVTEREARRIVRQLGELTSPVTG